MGLISGQAGPSHNEVSCSLSETGAEKVTKLQFFPLAQQASSKDVTAWRFSRSEKAGLGANVRRRRWSCLGKPTGLPKWLEWAGWWFWSIKWWSRPASPESSTSAEHWGIYSYYSRSSANSGKREKRNLLKTHSQSKLPLPNRPHPLPILLEHVDHQFPHKMKGREGNSLAFSALSLFLWLQIEHLRSLTRISYQPSAARSRVRLLFQRSIRPCHQIQIYLMWSLDFGISYWHCTYAS